MSVTIVFLGPLADLANGHELEVAGPLDWAGLLRAVGPDIAREIQADRVNVACGGSVLADKKSLQARDGDEIALLPPVSGG
ncbi:MoaD/ThiS family protein [Qipengyuania flava]|uniref:MoaD/ThiS family protein n=1 Tax=Qipengyuania aestuarii TaxID=2867241 RepID=UPI001C8746A9|nr:MoaD/ThiS family protein [Qipengyuania aestuarii]MBX7534739.1 MoaD/ThiS family protein [Qipengyuania aestuarii]MCA0977052.1 MoaD/ThiS family protein [Qipengyuania flava]